MHRSRTAIIIAAAVLIAACGSGGSSEEADSTEAGAEAGTGTETETAGFTVVLPEAPEGDIGAESTGVPGPTVPAERIDGEAYVWCDDLDLNPNEDAPTEAGVWAIQGEGEPGERGVFWILTFSAEKFSPGDVVTLPSESWELVFFYLGDAPELSPTVWELNSDQEESFGTLTLHEIPCQGDGDTLRFSLDGGIGSERNPGYIAWGEISGGFSGEVTGPPDGIDG